MFKLLPIRGFIRANWHIMTGVGIFLYFFICKPLITCCNLVCREEREYSVALVRSIESNQTWEEYFLNHKLISPTVRRSERRGYIKICLIFQKEIDRKYCMELIDMINKIKNQLPGPSSTRIEVIFYVGPVDMPRREIFYNQYLPTQ